MLGLARGQHHVTRYSMYQALGKVNLGLSGHVLTISHSANLADLLGITATQITEANYPQASMLSLPYPDSCFDFVLSDQVLEHVNGSPQAAIDECTRVLKPGGIACHTTCFMNPKHEAPGQFGDYWRFTDDGLRILHAKYSEIIECGAWGNFDVWTVVADGLRFAKIPHAKWHPLHRIAVKNDPEWAVMTWVVAKK